MFVFGISSTDFNAVKNRLTLFSHLKIYWKNEILIWLSDLFKALNTSVCFNANVIQFSFSSAVVSTTKIWFRRNTLHIVIVRGAYFEAWDIQIVTELPANIYAENQQRGICVDLKHKQTLEIVGLFLPWQLRELCIRRNKSYNTDL